MGEQDDTIVTLQDIDYQAGYDGAATDIAKQCAALILEGQDAKTRQVIDFYQAKWGPEEARDQFESALILLHLTAPGLLEAYCSSFHDGERRDIIHKLSISELEMLLGGKQEGDAREQSHCVYVHAWHGTGGIFSALFECVEIAMGSVSAHNLRSKIREIPAEESLLLAYVGYTSSPSVQQRKDFWGYDYNVLMSALWDDAEPDTLIAFALPDAQQQSGGEQTLLTLQEFLLVELLGTWSLIGLNQQPGGPGFIQQNWLNYTECSAAVQGRGLLTQEEFYSWCKANPEERRALGIPYDPYTAYKSDGWVGWNAFLGTPPPVRASTQLSYAECSAKVQERGLLTTEEFHSWCKANPEERRALGIPYTPNKAYKFDGWVNWKSFLGTDWLNYTECSAAVQGRGLLTTEEFYSWCKANPEERRALGIPYDPYTAYKSDGWVNWKSFLGTEKTI